MKCEDYIILLDEYLDDELEKSLHDSVSTHLTICSSCQAEFEILQRERVFYRKVDGAREKSFVNNWTSLRERLKEESLIKENVEVIKEDVSWITAIKIFWRKQSFVFDTMLVLLSLLTTGILIQLYSVNQTKETVIAENTLNNSMSFNTNRSFSEKETDSQPEESFPAQTLISEKKIKLSKPKPVAKYVENKQFFRTKAVVINNAFAEKDNSRNKKTKALTSKALKSIETIENNTINQSSLSGEKNLTAYYNKVALFLMTVRNVENAKELNAVIGEDFQTKAQKLLQNQDLLKKDVLPKKDLPTFQLLNEIEPILSKISTLNSQIEDTEIKKVIKMVKESGVVTKIRLQILSADNQGAKTY